MQKGGGITASPSYSARRGTKGSKDGRALGRMTELFSSLGLPRTCGKSSSNEYTLNPRRTFSMRSREAMTRLRKETRLMEIPGAPLGLLNRKQVSLYNVSDANCLYRRKVTMG